MKKGELALIITGTILGVAVVTCIILWATGVFHKKSKGHSGSGKSGGGKSGGGKSGGGDSGGGDSGGGDSGGGSTKYEELKLDPDKGSKLAVWSWKGTSTGGFGGYGIFGNDANPDYTYISNKAIGPNTNITNKWDEQIQNTMAYTPLSGRKAALNSKTGGSQLWDFISRKGSYYQTYKRRSLDCFKREFDGKPDQPAQMSDRYKELITNLSNEGIEVAILIGGKPNLDGTKYHGESLTTMLNQITSAGNWITNDFQSNNGVRPYIALDIEPADILIDKNDLSHVEEWYKTIFPQVATRINTFNGKDIYFGMAINKNPYSLPNAYKALKVLMSANWTIKDGKQTKQRGFRVLELMYWFTYVDFKDASHLKSQLTTTSSKMNPLGNPTPLQDAVNHNIYLQFGVECTGEVDLLTYIPKNSTGTTLQGCNNSCGASKLADCYKSQNGVADVDTNLGYLCKSPTNKNSPQAKTMFTTPSMLPTDNDKYYNAARFTGSSSDYAAVYGFPYVGYCAKKGSKVFSRCECNALGKCDPSHTTQKWDESLDPETVSSAPNYESCKYLNSESWLLGGGLNKDMSLEKLFHSESALDYLKTALGSLDNVYRIPFCVEDLSGYAGWLRNFTKTIYSYDFPDENINFQNPSGSICSASPQRIASGLDWEVNNVTLPCLGQTVLDDSGSPLWIAGTLENDGTCNINKYYFSQKQSTG